MPKVVISGLGLFTSLGKNVKEFLLNIKTKISGISKITLFDTSNSRTFLGGEIKNINLQNKCRIEYFIDRSLKEALADANISKENLYRKKILLIIGTTHGKLSQINKKKKSWQRKWEMAENINKYLSIKCQTLTISTACTSSSIALGLAFQTIKNLEVDFAIVIGAEELTEFVFSGFNVLRALSKTICRPFDEKRDGLILGEGSGAIILENINQAQKRKAKIYAEIAGFGASQDANHLTSPHPEGIGLIQAINHALNSAKISFADVKFIQAHGTGTIFNDAMEIRAFKSIFKDKITSIPINSIKSFTGHTSGACGAIEAAFCALCIRNNIIGPNLNLENPIKGINLPTKLIEHYSHNTVISTNSAFGGNNTCLVLKNA
jgi:3-oxoacyl-[acyl-carrier-protein] synthase II